MDTAAPSKADEVAVQKATILLSILGLIVSCVSIYSVNNFRSLLADSNREINELSGEIQRISDLSDSFGEALNDHNRRISRISPDLAESFSEKIRSLQMQIRDVSNKIELIELQRALKR